MTIHDSPSTIHLGEIDVRQVARLARLELSADEAERFGRELGSVLEFVEALKRVDVSDVEPTAHTAELINVFRADEAAPVVCETAEPRSPMPRVSRKRSLHRARR